MEAIQLTGKVRTSLGKKSAKTDRGSDLVPCVLYGGAANTSFTLVYNELRKAIYTDTFSLVQLNVDGKSTQAVIKEVQFHPVSDKMIHVDFQEVVPGQMVKTTVGLATKGFAKGQKDGGKLELIVKKVKVKAEPGKIPSKIEIDVTNLELGKSLRVRDIVIDGVEILNSPSVPVVAVTIPRALKGAMQAAAKA